MKLDPDFIIDRLFFSTDSEVSDLVVAYCSGRLELLTWPRGDEIIQVKSVYQVGGNRVVYSARFKVIIAASFSGMLVAYSSETGALIWEARFLAINSILLDRGNCLVQYGDNFLQALAIDSGVVQNHLRAEDVVNVFDVGTSRLLVERSELIELKSSLVSCGICLSKKSFAVLAAVCVEKLLIVSWSGGVVVGCDQDSGLLAWEFSFGADGCVLMFGPLNNKGGVLCVISIFDEGYFLASLDLTGGMLSKIVRLSTRVGVFHPTEMRFLCGDGIIIDLSSGGEAGVWKNAV